MPLTKITGGEFDSTQGGLSVAGIITASSDLLVSGKTYISGGLGVGINNNTAGSISASGNITFSSGYHCQDYSFEKIFATSVFATGASVVPNKAIDIRIPNSNSFWGWIEVSVTSSYNYQNSPGKLTKLFAVGVNGNGNIYATENRIVDAIGPIAANFAIGDFSWDATNSVYKIPISHIVGTSNALTIIVKAYSQGGTATIYSGLDLGPVYSLTALSPQIPSYDGSLIVGGNLGIGTNAPFARTHIEINAAAGAGSGSAAALWLRNSNQTANNSATIFAGNNSSQASAAINFIHNDYTTNAGAISFDTRTNSSTYAERMRIDSAGRVTTPYQPSFQAFSSSNVPIGSGTNVLPFNATNFNVGSHYNTSTYRFTAPVAGVYLFSVNLNLYTAPGIMMPAVRINGSSEYYGSRLSGNISGDNNLNLIVLLSLSVNDYVEALSATQGSATISNGAAWTRFEGRLLG
jgi:hypothetical protein